MRRFDSVVSGQVDFEVCRSFLAMLQLANNGNLHVVNPTIEGKTKNVPKVLQNGEFGIRWASSKRSDGYNRAYILSVYFCC